MEKALQEKNEERENTRISVNNYSFKFQVLLFDLYANKKYPFELDDNLTGTELKQVFFTKAEQYDPNEYNLRMLFGGAEIKESDNLYQHSLKDGFTIQMMVSKKDNVQVL